MNISEPVTRIEYIQPAPGSDFDVDVQDELDELADEGAAEVREELEALRAAGQPSLFAPELPPPS